MEIKIKFIIWPRRIITNICDEIPTKVKWRAFCSSRCVKQIVDGHKMKSYFAEPIEED